MSDEEIPTIGVPLTKKGKPRQRISKWSNLFPQELIRHMSNGLSFESFGSVAGVTRMQLYKWEELHPVFKEAHEIGDMKCRYFWEATGIKGLHGKIPNFSASVWIFSMKCRFGYRDGTETGKQAESREEVVYQSRWGNLAVVPQQSEH